MKSIKQVKQGYIKSLLRQNCPHCRHGKMFKHRGFRQRDFMQMYDKCMVCGQDLELAPGFYYGTSYVSYALTVAFSATTFVVWWVLIGISINDDRIFWWLGVNAVLMLLLQPFFMRLSRAVWISFFVKYDSSAGCKEPVSESL